MQLFIETLLQSPSRVLATAGPMGINVVPVSVVTTCGDDIILYDFFMDKTVCNLKASPAVAITAWDGLVGVQIKGEAKYENEGTFFLTQVQIMKERFPERVLRGIIRLHPMAVYSVSAGVEAGKKLL